MVCREYRVDRQCVWCSMVCREYMVDRQCVWCSMVCREYMVDRLVFDGRLCDAPNPRCPLTTRQPVEILCLVLRDTHMSKIATWAHTSILIKIIINYIPLVQELFYYS